MMKKAGAILFGLLMLSGCALPLPLRVASWAVDGVSFITTKKTISDHGISIVSKRDCAIWRSIVARDVCHDVILEII